KGDCKTFSSQTGDGRTHSPGTNRRGGTKDYKTNRRGNHRGWKKNGDRTRYSRTSSGADPNGRKDEIPLELWTEPSASLERSCPSLRGDGFRTRFESKTR